MSDTATEDEEISDWFVGLLGQCRDSIVEQLLDDSLANDSRFTTEQYMVAHNLAWKAPEDWPKEFRIRHEVAGSHLRNCKMIVEISPDVWGLPPLTEEETAMIERSSERMLERVLEMIRESREQRSASS